MVKPEDLIGKTFSEAYTILGIPKILKYKNKNYDIRTGRISAINTPLEEEPAEQLRISSLEDAIFALDVADTFKADGVLADSAGAGTTEEYVNYNPPKPGLLQRLKKKHPLAYKGLVIAATVLSVGLAAFSIYHANLPTKEKVKPTPLLDSQIPSFFDVWLPSAGNLIVLGSYDDNINKVNISLDVLTLNNEKVGTYRFEASNPYYNSPDFSSKFFSVSYDRNLTETLFSGPCIAQIKINEKNLNPPYEIKILPKNIIGNTNVILYNQDTNYGVWASTNPSNLIGTIRNISYNCTIKDLNKNAVFHQTDINGTLSPYGAGVQDVFIKANKTLLRAQQIYTMNLAYTVNVVSNDGKNISYTGYINNMPFIPERTAQLDFGK